VEDEDIAAEPALEAHPLGREEGLSPVSAEGVLLDVILVDLEEALPADLALERDVDVVVAALGTDLALQRKTRDLPDVGPVGSRAVERARVALIEAVTGNVVRAGLHRAAAGVDDLSPWRLDEAEPGRVEEGEIGPQAKLVVAGVGVGLDRVGGRRSVLPVKVEVLAIRAASLGRVERPEAGQEPGRHEVQRNLPRGVPGGLVACHAEG